MNEFLTYKVTYNNTNEIDFFEINKEDNEFFINYFIYNLNKNKCLKSINKV
jgi:hypothetical protein